MNLSYLLNVGTLNITVRNIRTDTLPTVLDEVPSEASRSLLHNRCDLKRHPGLAGIFVNYIILVCYETS